MKKTPHYPQHYLQHYLARVILAVFTFVALTAGAATQTATYYPPPGDKWERRKPEQVGMDAAKLEAAIEYIRTYKR